MTLLDEMRSGSIRGLTCGLERFTATLADTDRADLATALADPTITATAIWKALRNRGATFGSDVVRRHRQGACSCESR